MRTPEPAEVAAQELTPAFCERMNLAGGVFVAGIGWSAVVVSSESSAASTPVRLTKPHWAYYALYMEIDRGLLGVLNQQRWSQHEPLKQLEADAEAVFADYLRVMDARARLDSHLTALGGDELAIWETIARVQRFDAVVDAVRRKLDVLEKLAQRRVAQATADRARRMGDILGYLTVLTVVTVTGGIIGLFLGSTSPAVGPLWLRIGIIVVAVAVAAWLYRVIFIKTARAPAPYARQRRNS